MVYNWLYNTSNENVYVLIVIIVILGIIIYRFKFYKKKSDNFYNIQNNVSTTAAETVAPTVAPTVAATVAPTVAPTTTKNDASMNPNFYVSEEEIARRNAWSHLDGNDESLANTNGTIYKNDILYFNTSDNNNNSSSNSPYQPVNYSTIGDYATLDSLGSSLTDTLGGIKVNLDYTLLEEQLGTFNNYSKKNETSISTAGTYDNTANYKTGMNPATVDGTSTGKISGYGTGFSGKYTQDNRPLFLQKDFEGVANIFAPNIIISNAPLDENGNPDPDITFEM